MLLLSACNGIQLTISIMVVVLNLVLTQYASLVLILINIISYRQATCTLLFKISISPAEICNENYDMG